MTNIINIWKHIGETPLQATERARKEYGIDTTPSCFTGRLDPMAQGTMVALFGDAIKLQDHYNSCDKTYRFQAILGISTDTYDPMGSIIDMQEVTSEQVTRYNTEMLNISGKLRQPFPPYSAYRYKGHPLWWHARNGSLPIEMPAKERVIYSVKQITRPVCLTVSTYRKSAISDMKEVAFYNGDKFNCKEHIQEWRKLNGELSVWRVQYEITVSSGTYIRSIVHNLGQRLNIPAHAARITRIGQMVPGTLAFNPNL
jgi:tRNA pseudouridine55 synthase